MVEPARRSAWVTSNGLALRCIVSGLTIKPSEEWFVRGTIRNVTHRRIPLIQTPFGTLGRGHTEFTTGDGADVEQIMTGDVYPGRGWDAVLLRAGHEITMNHRFELSAPRGKVGFGIRRYADLLLEEFPRGWIVEPGPIEVRFSIQNEHMNIPASRHPPKEETPFMERFGIPGWRGRLTTPPIQVEIRDEPQE
jgi:hypothetical protein